jgi:hypothetical protein
VISKRNTIIFGNGLGMALDNEYFLLESGLKTIWNTSDNLTEDHKRLIRTALPDPNCEYPKSEEMLADIQLAIFASQILKVIEKGKEEWLSEKSRGLIPAFKKYVHQVGMYFQAGNHELPKKFTYPLSQYLKKTRSHIGVLNYDDLLYNALISTNILNGYYGTLIDGYSNCEFNPKSLDKYRKYDLGFFLNLHGSPLFVGNRKVYGKEKKNLEANDESHIVLTHSKYKQNIILQSEILSEYWRRLEEALNESEKLVLFGYSGKDDHLNILICTHFKQKEISVIEWDDGDDLSLRENYWGRQLDREMKNNVMRMSDILGFTDWEKI